MCSPATRAGETVTQKTVQKKENTMLYLVCLQSQHANIKGDFVSIDGNNDQWPHPFVFKDTCLESHRVRVWLWLRRHLPVAGPPILHCFLPLYFNADL